MLLENAIGNEIKVRTRKDSVNKVYNGILLWPKDDDVMSVFVEGRTLNIPYAAIVEYDFLGKKVEL